MLRDLNIEITCNHEINNSKPTLVISNHVSILDLFILRSICIKDELYIIVLNVWKKVLKALEKEILPVYLSKKPADHFLDKIRNRLYTLFESNMSREEATHLNKYAISQATNIINNGGSVVIFPSGGKLKQGSNWESGVGYIINQLYNNEAQIVLVKIKNTYRADILKFTYLNLFNKHRIVNIIISAPIHIKTIQDKKITEKVLVQKIQKMYETMLN